MHPEHRRQLRRMFGQAPPRRDHDRDRFALLLPHGMPLTATVRELARDLGTPEIVENPWPDRLTRSHLAAQAAGHDVTAPVVWVERWVEPELLEERKLVELEELLDRADRLRLELLALRGQARSTAPVQDPG